MQIKKDLEELLQAGIITENISNDILVYYKNKKGSSPNRLFLVFGILGALLVGLGIVLILAHNWDQLPRSAKTIFAFVPLLMGQIACGYVLLKKAQNTGWKEGASTFLFLAIGICISLISQIYNIPGNISSFLMIWMLLGLPLIYIMKSSTASLMYLIGITYYAAETSYFSYPQQDSYLYWLFLLAAIPHYFQLIKKTPAGNFTSFHHWAIPLSSIICLGTLTRDTGEFMFIGYFSLFGICMLLGKASFLKKAAPMANAYRLLGILGSLIILFMFSFKDFWKVVDGEYFNRQELIYSQEIWIALALTLAGIFMLYNQWRKLPFSKWNPIEAVFLVFAGIFTLGMASPQAAMILINLIILSIGLWVVVYGTQQDHLGTLNFGLLIITVLILCRFLDTDLSFILRGILFIGLGISFFATNYLMLKKRKNHA